VSKRRIDRASCAPPRRRAPVSPIARRDFLDTTTELIERSGANTAFHYLLETERHLSDESDRNELWIRAGRKHPELVQALRPVAAGRMRRARIEAIRSQVTNSDLQFFLALLLNVPHRRTLMRLIYERYPGIDPRMKVAGWLGELSSLGYTDTPIVSAWAAVAGHLLDGRSMNEIQRIFHKGHNNSSMIDQEIATIADSIRNNWMFADLLTDQE
jgi:hypothetical protein